MSSTRERIIEAAVEIATGDQGQNLSVRVVAARAGVGMGTLRHHFPTQLDLRTEVINTLYARSITPSTLTPDGRDPADQLQDALTGLLSAYETAATSRLLWHGLFASLVDPDGGPAAQATLSRLGDTTIDHIAHWLAALEGPSPIELRRQRARILLTVLNGVAVDRALEDSPSRVHEQSVLRFAVEHILRTSPARPPAGGGDA